MNPPTSSIRFQVHRREPELIVPAKPTPYEFKPLSDIDDQEGLRFHIPVVQIYKHVPSMQGKDPVKVIKEALAKALVFYYPFAGRLREWPNRKLVVECTSEGVLFIEADADVTLEQCRDALQPPLPLLDELLFDVPGSSGVINCPLLLIQVTRFKCGGFIFTLRLNHTMSDGFGLVQFMTAVGEMARGKQTPSIFPVWERQVLDARNPPITTCTHPEYNENNRTVVPFPLDDLAEEAFFFGPTEISALRRLASSRLCRCSTFEILTACLWKCRTIALQPNPTQEIRMICLTNARDRFDPPLIPKGYYGNGFVLSTAVTTVGELLKEPMNYAIELIKRTKANMTREYVQSVADTLVIKGRPLFPLEGTYIISDVRHAKFTEVDFGWGRAKYGGPVKAIPMFCSFCVPFENKKGENGFILPICLPAQAMKRFAKELKILLQDKPVDSAVRSLHKQSAL
ncbi:benzyl alcohol O-benzoyltransferase-like [Ricinus communis]|uniref:benzyl alcohol O-benzoyltransferase-like n=1 Tax=Ricinus communis TaxID=3988 RepID=UPI00201A80B8|nr:benzyl alcohol O-benzoyltransferase-like [Ricinus communis]